MANKIRFCLALSMALSSACLVHCAAEVESPKTNKMPPQDPDSVVSESPLDIPKEQKKLSSELADLRKLTSKQKGKLEKAIKDLNSKIGKIEDQIGNVGLNKKYLEEVQQGTEELLNSIHMKVDQSGLSKENIGKTIENAKTALQTEIADTEAALKRLSDELDSQKAPLEAKAKENFDMFYEQKISAKRTEYHQCLDEYKNNGGDLAQMKNERISWNKPNAELHNKCVELRGELHELIYEAKESGFHMNHEACEKEGAEVDSLYRPYNEKRKQLLEKERQFHKHLDKLIDLENKRAWMELGPQTLPTAEEMQKLEEMRNELEGKNAETEYLKLREILEDVDLVKLIECLKWPLSDSCKFWRKDAEKYGQKVAQGEKEAAERANGDQKSAGRRRSRLVEGLGKLLGHFKSGQKHSTLAFLAQLIQVYDRAEKEAGERKKTELYAL